MLFFATFHILVIAGLAAAAAAIPANGDKPQLLGENDVVLFGHNGRVEIMNKDVYTNLSKPGLDPHPGRIELASASNSSSRNNHKKIQRRCGDNTIYSYGGTSDFLDWDVPMSAAVQATDMTLTLQVASGYTVTNVVSVSGGFDLSAVTDFLTSDSSIQYAQAWTTTSPNGFVYKLPPGKYSAIVSNPQTHRVYGTITDGCIGQPSTIYNFAADSRQSLNQNGLAWVQGVISLCTGDTYPLHRCLGQGFLY